MESGSSHPLDSEKPNIPSDSSSDDEFFDASSSEEVSKSSDPTQQLPQPTEETALPSKEDKPLLERTKEEEEGKNHEDPPINADNDAFAAPKAPPRRRKKSIKSTDQSLAESTVKITLESETPPSESAVPEIWTNAWEDIASIQGDLSVNEALLTGDKKSICVDDLSCEKGATHDISPSRFRYEDNEQTIETNNKHIESEDLPKETEETLATTVSHDGNENLTKPTATTNRPSTPDPQEVLESVMIKNIDTGETLPLSKAEDIVGKCINPLDLHLKKITSDYASDAEDTDAGTSSIEGAPDAEGGLASQEHESLSSKAGKQVKSKLKGGLKRVGRVGKTVIQGAKQTVEMAREKHRSAKEATEHPLPSHVVADVSHHQFRLKVNKKGPADFDGLRLMQELHDCRGAVWVMKWSVDGQLLAVAGQDQLLRVYCSSKAWKYFTQLRNKASGQQTSPSSTKDRSFSASRSNSMSSNDNLSADSTFSPGAMNSRLWSEDNTLSEEGPLLLFSAYRGHSADVLDISWSKNHFLLSSSMDRTVRLWHVTRVECLCTLRHADFVTTISFHPKDDRYFLSGSLDGKLRLWNIPDKRVTLWNEVSAVSSQPRASKEKDPHGAQSHGLITASAFVQNGKFAVIGTYDGRVIFYSTDQLKYFTQLHVTAKGIVSAALSDPTATLEGRGRRRKRSNKVTGIESVGENKILVTTNDSRLRLYDLRDLSLVCKYKGCTNQSSQIRASVSHDNKFIVCGSENSSFFIWRLEESTAIGQRRDKNSLWECVRILPASSTSAPVPHIPDPVVASASAASSKSSPGIITAATFAPAPKYMDEESTYVIAAADFSGVIRLFSK